MNSAQDDKFMRYVKLFNVVAGILLIGGTITLVVALIFRNDEEPKATAQSVTAEPVLAITDKSDIELQTNPGSRIVERTLSASTLLLTTEDASGTLQHFLIDLATGQSREIRLTSALRRRPKSQSKSKSQPKRHPKRMKAGPVIELDIERLGYLGDGLGRHEGQDVRVALTLPGERWQVELTDKRGGVVQGRALEAIHSVEREPSSCRHFGECGGCSLQHLTPDAYDALKRRRIEDALRNRGLDCPPLAPTAKSPPASRRRLRLAFDGQGRLGLRRRSSHGVVALEMCPISDPAIQSALPNLNAWTRRLGKPGELLVTASDCGLDLLLLAEQRPGLSMMEALGGDALDAEALDAEVWARVAYAPSLDDHPEVLSERSAPSLTLGGVKLGLPIGGFLQATQDGEAQLQAFAQSRLQGATRLVDLFCGIGTFALHLSALSHEVTAFDNHEGSVKALRATGRCRHVETVDLMSSPIPATSLSRFDAAILDPPRGGAAMQCAQIAQSALKSIVYASCDPKSFARDFAILNEAGFVISELLPIDQFLYSAEIELVAQLRRE